MSRISVVIPTLDEEAELPLVLDHLARLAGDWEVIVADGGSRDATTALARSHPRVDALVEAWGSWGPTMSYGNTGVTP